MDVLLVCVLAQSLRCVWLFATPWTVAHQPPLSMESSRQEYWSGLPFPSPGDLPDPGIELPSLAMTGEFFTTASSGKPRGPIWFPHKVLGCMLLDLHCRGKALQDEDGAGHHLHYLWVVLPGWGAGRVGGQVQEFSSCLKPVLHGPMRFSASVLLSSCGSHDLVSTSGSCPNLKKPTILFPPAPLPSAPCVEYPISSVAGSGKQLLIYEDLWALNLPRAVYSFEEMESSISGSETESKPSIASTGILMMPFLQCHFENDGAAWCPIWFLT